MAVPVLIGRAQFHDDLFYAEPLAALTAHAGTQLLKSLTASEGPADIDEPKYGNRIAIKHPCRTKADANAEMAFGPKEPGLPQFETKTEVWT